MKPSSYKIILACIVVGGLIAGCATTQMMNMWRNDEYHGAPLRNVLVVRVTKNITNRRSYEDRFVKELNKIGIKGIPSYRFLSDRNYSDNTFNIKEITAMAKEAAFDGVIMSRVVSRDNHLQYVPGYNAMMPGYIVGQGNWIDDAYESGSYKDIRIVSVETEVWSVRGNCQLIWTGLSKTIDPASIGKMGRELTKIVIGELREVKLL